MLTESGSMLAFMAPSCHGVAWLHDLGRWYIQRGVGCFREPSRWVDS